MSREDLAKLTRTLQAYVDYQKTSRFDSYTPAPQSQVDAFRNRKAAPKPTTISASRSEPESAPTVSPVRPNTTPPSAVSESAPASRPPARKDPAAAAENQLWKTLDLGEPTSKKQDQPASGEVETLEQIRADLGDCQRCDLCTSRTNIVFGVGNPDARIMIVGEAPGFNEDKQAEPFVGKAGQLLNKMIKAMGYDRDEIYIANVLKCRPPNNRDPAPDEVAACSPFLKRQIAAINPDVIITMGKFASNTLAGTDGSLGKIRGRWHSFEGVPMMPTFHPAYLLRNESGKRDAWDDLKKVMAKLDDEAR